MADLPKGRFAYYQEELEALLETARVFFGRLKREGHVQIDRDWLLEEHAQVRSEGGAAFEALDVLAAANYLGLVELDQDEDGWIRIL